MDAATPSKTPRTTAAAGSSWRIWSRWGRRSRGRCCRGAAAAPSWRCLSRRSNGWYSSCSGPVGAPRWVTPGRRRTRSSSPHGSSVLAPAPATTSSSSCRRGIVCRCHGDRGPGQDHTWTQRNGQDPSVNWQRAECHCYE